MYSPPDWLRKGTDVGTCFVIQPFDRGRFDKRFDDVFVPAIEASGLDPYRVDRDPATSVPIDQIEAGIRSSCACLADITTDNPNVWFELGFAIASQKEVVLVCSQERKSRFPFDVQHRNIITYSTDSPRDFDDLKGRITNRLKAIQAKEAALATVASRSPIAEVEGLSQYEMIALVAIAQNVDQPNGSVSTFLIRQDMNNAGFTKVAATLGLASLLKKQLIELREAYDERSGESYAAYALTEKGISWLMSNQDRLVLREPPRTGGPSGRDDVPF